MYTSVYNIIQYIDWCGEQSYVRACAAAIVRSGHIQFVMRDTFDVLPAVILVCWLLSILTMHKFTMKILVELEEGEGLYRRATLCANKICSRRTRFGVKRLLETPRHHAHNHFSIRMTG